MSKPRRSRGLSETSAFLVARKKGTPLAEQHRQKPHRYCQHRHTARAYANPPCRALTSRRAPCKEAGGCWRHGTGGNGASDARGRLQPASRRSPERARLCRPRTRRKSYAGRTKGATRAACCYLRHGLDRRGTRNKRGRRTAPRNTHTYCPKVKRSRLPSRTHEAAALRVVAGTGVPWKLWPCAGFADAGRAPCTSNFGLAHPRGTLVAVGLRIQHCGAVVEFVSLGSYPVVRALVRERSGQGRAICASLPRIHHFSFGEFLRFPQFYFPNSPLFSESLRQRANSGSGAGGGGGLQGARRMGVHCSAR